jgi:hypothetical protein
MKRILIIGVFLLIAFSIYWFKFRTVNDNAVEITKLKPISTSTHSAIFNNSIDTLMGAYFQLKSAFVEADTTQAKIAAKSLLSLTDGIKLDELAKDTTAIISTTAMQISDIKVNIESLLKQTDITEMRQDFRMLSESIYPLLKTIHYEGATLYWQNCPMAFGEGKEANWISNTEEIVNPYLGKKDPEYKATMLHCGEVKDSIKAL